MYLFYLMAPHNNLDVDLFKQVLKKADLSLVMVRCYLIFSTLYPFSQNICKCLWPRNPKTNRPQQLCTHQLLESRAFRASFWPKRGPLQQGLKFIARILITVLHNLHCLTEYATSTFQDQFMQFIFNEILLKYQSINYSIPGPLCPIRCSCNVGS